MKKVYISLTAVTLLALLPAAIWIGWEYRKHRTLQQQIAAFQHHALQGYTFAARGELQAARDAYEEAHALYDKDPKTLFDTGNVYVRLGDYATAAAFFNRAFALDGDRYDARFNAAYCEYETGHYRDALAKATSLMHLDARRAKYAKLIALCEYKLGHTDAALGHYARAARHHRYANDPELAALKARYEASGTPIAPAALVFKYETTDDIGELFALAEAYHASGYDIKALRTFQKLLTLSPKNDAAHRGAARLLKAHGADEAALEHYLAVAHPGADVFEETGAVYHRLKQYRKALAQYEKAYALQPSRELARALTAVSFYLKDKKRLSKYFDAFKRYDAAGARELFYAMETEAGVEHTPWQKLRHLAVRYWYRFIGEGPDDA